MSSCILCSSHTDPKTKQIKTKHKTKALSLLRSLCLLFPLPGTFCTQIFACLAPSYHLDLNSDVTSSEWLVLCCLPSIPQDNTWHTVSEYLWRSGMNDEPKQLDRLVWADNHHTLSKGWQRSCFLWCFLCRLRRAQATPFKPQPAMPEKSRMHDSSKNKKQWAESCTSTDEPYQMP